MQKPKVIKQLNEEYYFISFDGESNERISFNTHKFYPSYSAGRLSTHEIVNTLATKDGEVSYPLIVLLNSKYEIMYQNNSFMSGDDLYNLLSLKMAQ